MTDTKRSPEGVPTCPSPENPCMCRCHADGYECFECKMGRHKAKFADKNGDRT